MIWLDLNTNIFDAHQVQHEHKYGWSQILFPAATCGDEKEMETQTATTCSSDVTKCYWTKLELEEEWGLVNNNINNNTPHLPLLISSNHLHTVAALSESLQFLQCSVCSLKHTQSKVSAERKRCENSDQECHSYHYCSGNVQTILAHIHLWVLL